MNDAIGSLVISDTLREFANQKKLAERALAQLSDQEFFASLDAESNSIAVLVKHVGGNLRSRWRDFLTTDGEKTDRHRDGEFIADTDSREAVTALWKAGWTTLEETLATLRPEDLLKDVRVRAEPLSVIQALHRSLAHTAEHVGQIILLAKHWRGAEWQTLSIPRGQSPEPPPS